MVTNSAPRQNFQVNFPRFALSLGSFFGLSDLRRDLLVEHLEKFPTVFLILSRAILFHSISDPSRLAIIRDTMGISIVW